MRVAIVFFLLIPAWMAAGGPVMLKTIPAGALLEIDSQPPLKTPCGMPEVWPGQKAQLSLKGYDTYSLTNLIDGARARKPLLVKMMPVGTPAVFAGQIPCGRRPKDLIWSPDGRWLVISTMEEEFIQLYDVKRNLMTNIVVPGYGKIMGFVEGVFTPDGREFWFNQMHTSGRVFVLDMEKLTLKTNFSSRGNWTKVGEFSPDGLEYYLSNWLSGTVTIFSRTNYAYLGSFRPAGKEPRGIGFSPDGRYVYVSMFGSGNVGKYDRHKNHALVTNIELGGNCGRIRMDYPRGKAYIGNMAHGSYYVLNLADDRIEKKVRAWVNVNNVKLSPDGRQIAISCRGVSGPAGYMARNPEDGQVILFDAATHEKKAVLPAGNQPIGVAYSPDGKTLATSNYMDDTIDFWIIPSL